MLFSQATYSVLLRTAGAGAPSALEDTMVEGVDHVVPLNLEYVTAPFWSQKSYRCPP